MVAVDAAGSHNQTITGVIFEPFEELKHKLSLVPTALDQSIARQRYFDECESAINEQIKCVSFFPESFLC